MKFLSRQHKKFSWEEYAIETYNDFGGIGSEQVLLRQCWVNAKDIDLAEYSDISEQDFPWHGYTYEDFVKLNTLLQACLKDVKRCKSYSDVKKFIRRNRDVYKAYFKSPICVHEKDGDTGYSFGIDGRHRIFVAQRNNALLPVWVVEWVDVSKMTQEEYVRSFCGGGWRFYEEANINEEKIREIKIRD